MSLQPAAPEGLGKGPQESSTSAPSPDPFDTPIFKSLISLIQEQNAVAKEQREAIKEQGETMKAMKITLERQEEQLKVIALHISIGQLDVSCFSSRV